MTNCPTCETDTLKQHGPELHGQRWYYCSNTKCRSWVLIRISDGEILRTGKG